ncbi:MAG: 50S ribosomal protein L6 [Bacteroidota bacterium]
MSRIGNQPIKLPVGTTLARREENVIYIHGPKGALTQYIDPTITVTVDKNHITLTRRTDQKPHKALHGLYRALIANMVIGVSEGFKKTLELIGVGYKASAQNNVLELNLGYAHTIYFVVPPEITVQTETTKGKSPLVHLAGIDKQLVGQVAAKLRALRKVEPYKGKGIRFLGEKVRRKAGKTTTK